MDKVASKMTEVVSGKKTKTKTDADKLEEAAAKAKDTTSAKGLFGVFERSISSG